MGQWVGSGHITKNQINLDLIEIIQILFEDLRFVETSPTMSGCMGGWVDGWFSGSMGGVRSYY